MISLNDLIDRAAYAVSVEPGADIIVRGDTLRRRWQSKIFPKVPPDLPLPPNYVRVTCDANQFVALWRDPSRPELAEPQPGEAAPTTIQKLTTATALTPPTLLGKRVLAVMVDDGAFLPEPIDQKETLNSALLKAGEQLAETLGLQPAPMVQRP